MKNNITFWIFIGIIFIIIALLILNDHSFNLMGIGIIIIGICFLLAVNQKKWFTFFIKTKPNINSNRYTGISLSEILIFSIIIIIVL